MIGEDHEKISLRFGVHGRLDNSRSRSIRVPGFSSLTTAPDYAPRYMWEERSAPQMPENYEKQRTPNNALSGPIGLGDPNAVGGECAKGFSEETCQRRGEKYNPPGQN